MKTVKAYRLGHDDYVTYELPSKRSVHRQLEESWGSVYSLVERKTVEGGIPQPWNRIEQ